MVLSYYGSTKIMKLIKIALKSKEEGIRKSNGVNLIKEYYMHAWKWNPFYD
jgi:hypothetical protein